MGPSQDMLTRVHWAMGLEQRQCTQQSSQIQRLRLGYSFSPSHSPLVPTDLDCPKKPAPWFELCSAFDEDDRNGTASKREQSSPVANWNSSGTEGALRKSLLMGLGAENFVKIWETLPNVPGALAQIRTSRATLRQLSPLDETLQIPQCCRRKCKHGLGDSTNATSSAPPQPFHQLPHVFQRWRQRTLAILTDGLLSKLGANCPHSSQCDWWIPLQWGIPLATHVHEKDGRSVGIKWLRPSGILNYLLNIPAYFLVELNPAWKCFPSSQLTSYLPRILNYIVMFLPVFWMAWRRASARLPLFHTWLASPPIKDTSHSKAFWNISFVPWTSRTAPISRHMYRLSAPSRDLQTAKAVPYGQTEIEKHGFITLEIS